MIGSDVFLYPDSGPEFLRTLKMAAMYSERVHALTLTDIERVESFREHARKEGIAISENPRQLEKVNLDVAFPILGAGVAVAATNEANQYLDFVSTNIDDLKLLTREKVLVSHFPAGFLYGGTFRADEGTVKALNRWPPSYWDFMRHLEVPDQPRLASFQAYLTFVAELAQQQRASLGSWSLDFQHELIKAVNQLADGGPISREPLSNNRESRSARPGLEISLANRIFERCLPAVDDLTFHDVLELRHSCRSEVKNFQISVQKLAAEIDLAQPPREGSNAVDDAISKEVEPALRDLENKLISARWDKKLLRSKVSAAAMTVSFFVSGFPADIKGLLTSAGAGAAGAVADSLLDRSQLLREHQWSMVFRLTRKVKRTLEHREQRSNPFTVGP